MIVEIEHAGFRMRDDTDYIRSSAGAVQFFYDFKIPYTLDTVGEQVVIRYHESLRHVDLPLVTVEDIRSLAIKYDLRLQVGHDGHFMVAFK